MKCLQMWHVRKRDVLLTSVCQSSELCNFLLAQTLCWNEISEPSPSTGFCQEFYHSDKGMHAHILLALLLVKCFLCWRVPWLLQNMPGPLSLMSLHGLCEISPRNYLLLKLWTVLTLREQYWIGPLLMPTVGWLPVPLTCVLRHPKVSFLCTHTCWPHSSSESPICP